MTVVRVKGFQIFRDRHGRWRCYHRATRTAVDLEQAPLGSAAFFAECARISAMIQAAAPLPGTFGLLVNQYRSSTAFRDLAPRTRENYERILAYLQPLADVPLSRFDRPSIVRIRDKAAQRGRAFGNYVKAVLSLVFSWGAERGYIDANPAEGIKNVRRTKGAPDPNRPWTDNEREAVLSELPAHMRPGLALMMFAGLGPKDALTLPRSFYKEGAIATRRSKTGEPVYWPVPAPLSAILDSAPAHSALTLCANSGGRPWTLSGFRASWRPIRLRLEATGRVGPHPLRATPHCRSHSTRDRARRADHRRRARAKDN